jgi:hypothetical protein
MAHPMKKRFILAILPPLFFTACGLIEIISQVDDDPSIDNPSAPISSEGGELAAPSPIDEKITCTYYVAPNGRDDAPGSESQPWISYQHAADSVQPGDTVCFRGGNYLVEDTVRISESGTADNRIRDCR